MKNYPKGGFIPIKLKETKEKHNPVSGYSNDEQTKKGIASIVDIFGSLNN